MKRMFRAAFVGLMGAGAAPAQADPQPAGPPPLIQPFQPFPIALARVGARRFDT